MNKKIMVMMLAFVLISVYSFAQEKAEVKQDSASEAKSALPQDRAAMMNSKAMKGSGPRDVMKDMKKMMMPVSMVSTNDGGVIVLAGKKLLKYDANLALVKEVEIAIECPCMSKMPMAGMDKPGMDMPGMQKDAPEESKE